MTVAALEGLSSTRVPILLIYGVRDELVKPRPAIARALELDPQLQSTLYPDSGHAPFIEEPVRFNHDLADFIEAAAQHRAHSSAGRY